MMFDIQRFGDNDTVVSSNEGILTIGFYDSDDRQIKIDDPRSDLTAAEVNAIVDWTKQNQPIIGDKTGASVVGAKSFETIAKTTTYLDITPPSGE